MPVSGRRHIPESTLARLHCYQLVLRRLLRAGEDEVSSRRMGLEVGIDPALVRKDLCYLHCRGQRGVGYQTRVLLAALERVLGPPVPRPLVIIGAGPLGTALAGYAGFEMLGYQVVGIFDENPARVGHHVQGMRVRPMRELATLVTETGVRLALMAVPAARAQETADRCAAAGLRGLLTFGPVRVRTRPEFYVRQVDVSAELEILNYQTEETTTARG